MLVIHRFDLCIVASMGVSEGKTIGEWFGPNTVAQVLRYAQMVLSLTAEFLTHLMLQDKL